MRKPLNMHGSMHPMVTSKHYAFIWEQELPAPAFYSKKEIEKDEGSGYNGRRSSREAVCVWK